jgi:hypothetical protein
MYRGSQVFVGLPLLEAMLNSNGDALAGGDPLPLRFISYYWADGIYIPEWEPPTVGANWQANPSVALESLAADPIGPYVSILSGLRNRSSAAITHHEGMTAFNGYTFVNQNGLNTDSGGPTIDQLVADAIGDGTTPIRAMHVQVSKKLSTDGDGGTTVIAMSHRGTPGNLIAQVPQVNPIEVWNTVFGEFVPKPDDRDLRLSILDFVKEDVNRLRPRLGTVDNQRLDAHLQGVADLETKISNAPPTCMLPNVPTEDNSDMGGVEPIGAVTTAMIDLIAHAFLCDVTRVATVMFKRFVSSTVFTEAGLGAQHHSASHNNDGDSTYRAGVTYQMEKLAELLTRLQSEQEIDGTNLLDSTILYASSDCSTGNTHSIQRQPIILAGKGRDYLVHPGIHYQTAPWNNNNGSPNGSGNMSDVLLSCLQAFDPAATEIGGGAPYSNTPLPDVVA